ncbi:hypothetical protein CW368_12250 [Actinomycetales bacterium SN12]|nr:hypothetical protein CW368_12250 [Actinomycetales bacterium SN12]
MGNEDLDFGVMLDDLTSDAAKWREVNGVLSTALSTARACQLGFGVTDGLSFAAGFKGHYDSAHQEFVTYLEQGVTALEEIAVNLEDTRTTYEASDEYAQWKARQ